MNKGRGYHLMAAGSRTSPMSRGDMRYMCDHFRGSARVQISANGGAEPVWTANGSRIIYRAADKFIAASVSLSSEITVTTRQQLFEDEYQSSLFRSSYDV